MVVPGGGMRGCSGGVCVVALGGHAWLLRGGMHGFCQGACVVFAAGGGACMVFRWFKFTLKPPYSIVHDNLQLALWDTSFWTFWLKFGHKGP